MNELNADYTQEEARQMHLALAGIWGMVGERMREGKLPTKDQAAAIMMNCSVIEPITHRLIDNSDPRRG